MSAFITVTLPPRSPPRHYKSPKATSSDSPLSLDTLRNFESFCIRTQDTLCNQTAETDGLGTFDPSPLTFPAPVSTSRNKLMRGGRFFDTAIVSVWNSMQACRQRQKEGVGLSLKLAPRDPLKPSLRADAHYFQIQGGRTWWFSGAVDISYTVQVDYGVDAFLNRWQKVRKEKKVERTQETRFFLEECWRGDDIDRHAAYGFMTDVVHDIWPEYLKLLSGTPQIVNEERENVEEFCIQGGARCESQTVRGEGLGAWRFALAPSVYSHAGRMYVMLRNETPWDAQC